MTMLIIIRHVLAQKVHEVRLDVKYFAISDEQLDHYKKKSHTCSFLQLEKCRWSNQSIPAEVLENNSRG